MSITEHHFRGRITKAGQGHADESRCWLLFAESRGSHLMRHSTKGIAKDVQVVGGAVAGSIEEDGTAGSVRFHFSGLIKE
jgi:hypothetical protein